MHILKLPSIPSPQQKITAEGRRGRDVISSLMYVSRTTGCRRRAKAYRITTHFGERREEGTQTKHTQSVMTNTTRKKFLSSQRVRVPLLPGRQRGSGRGVWCGRVSKRDGDVTARRIHPRSAATARPQDERTENQGRGRKAPGRCRLLDFGVPVPSRSKASSFTDGSGVSFLLHPVLPPAGKQRLRRRRRVYS